MLTLALLRNLQFPAHIKSHPFSGVRSGPMTSVDVNISRIDSLEPYIGERTVIESPFKALQAFTYTDQKVETGMILEYDEKEYAIKGVAPFPDDSGFTFYQLILEDLVAKK